MPDYELRYLEACIQVLEQYLLSDELYWLPGITAGFGRTPYPSITPGNLLISKQKASVITSQGEEQVRFHAVQRQLDVILSHWRSAWEKKCQAEYANRLKLWSDFLGEYTREPEKQYDRFAYEVTRRVILQLLKGHISSPDPEEIEFLARLDQRLRAVFQPGIFAWSPDIQAAFPQDTYWYLYGTMKR